jgi:sugar O-acyltransferase (sialic acid O-acetyltransferase NeuD family)
MAIYGLVGMSGFGREVMPLFKANYENRDDLNQCVFVDINLPQNPVKGTAVYLQDDFLNNKLEEKFFNVAIADSKIRREVVEKFIHEGCKPVSIISETALIYDRNEIGEGAILCGYSHLTSDINIGKYFHCNFYSFVAHNCVIGDYVTFAPRVNCNGNVHIQDHVYIGTGAIIQQGKPEKPLVIGEGAIIGMGAVVTRDVEPYSVVVGNPARHL